jgi:hypothetical protein
MTLKPCSRIDVGCDPKIDDRWEVSHDEESLATCLEVGDYFVVVVTDDAQDNASFWILICIKRLHMVAQENTCRCIWSNVSLW